MIAIRLMAKHDRKFVTASWVASWRDSYASGLIQAADYWPIMFAQIDKVISRPDVVVHVAYSSEADDHVADLIGFVAADADRTPPLLFYVYTKQAYRRAGIARRLLEEAGIDPAQRFDYVCKNPLPRELTARIPSARWNPIPARYPKDDET